MSAWKEEAAAREQASATLKHRIAELEGALRVTMRELALRRHGTWDRQLEATMKTARAALTDTSEGDA